MENRTKNSENTAKKPSYETLEAKISELEKQLKKNVIILTATDDNAHLEIPPIVRLLLDNVPDLIWAKGKDNSVIFANQAACDKLYKCGCLEDAIGKNDLYFANKERSMGHNHTFGELCVDSDKIVKTTGKPGRFKEFGLVRGEELILDVTKSPIINNSGQIVGTVGCGKDITRAQKTEEALENASRIIRDLSDEIDSVAVQGYDENRIVTHWNKASEILYGYTKKEAFGQKLEDLIIPLEMRDGVIKNHKRWLEFGEKIPSGELILRNKDGESVHVFSSHVLKPTSHGMEMFCIDIDIAPLKEAEEERRVLNERLQHVQKMEAIGTLAGGIAHDFNNILAAIFGYADLGISKCELESPISKDFERIIQAGQRAKGLVNQILDFSRQKEIDVVPLLPGMIVKESLEMLRSSLPATVRIEESIDMESGYILADPTQIHQIFLNLCTNAFQAMEETGGVISVSVNKRVFLANDIPDGGSIVPGNFVQLSVRDNGPGMSNKIKEKIFTPYFTTKEIGKGTGMGLSIANTIIKNYKGFITCDSEIGKGTVFKVNIPAMYEYQVEKETPVVSSDTPRGNERILFVDDEEILCRMMVVMFEPLGYNVTTYSCSTEALTEFKKQPDAFDLVISDLNMPGISGFDLIKKIRSIRSDVPVVLCTGNISSLTEDAFLEVGISELAMKPLRKKELAVLIRRALNSKGL